MEWLLEPLAYPFMQRAFVAGILVAVTSSVVGTWVVMRGMSFWADALVHGVVPGIAFAIVAGFNPLLGAAGAAVVMVVGINLVHRQTAFREDTGIGLLFVGMLALGVIIVSRSASFSGSLVGILFGDALGSRTSDLVLLGIIAAVSLGVSVLLYRPFLALSFNEAKAELLGLRPRLAHFLMLTLITLAIVGSFQTVGTLLVFGLLVAPPATAALLVRRVPAMMATSAAVGVGSVVVGLLLSYHIGTSGSATMAVIAVVAFFVVLGWKALPGSGGRDPITSSPVAVEHPGGSH